MRIVGLCFIFRNAGYIAISYSVISSAKKLRRGDHIAWPTQQMKGVLAHHAIVLASKGDSVVKVIHVTGTQDGNEYEVVEQLIDVGDHIKNGKLWRYDYEPGKCYDPDKVITRAKEKVGKYAYDVLRNNCEHFARWCKTDKNVSVQATVTVGLAAAGVATAASSAGSALSKFGNR